MSQNAYVTVFSIDISRPIVDSSTNQPRPQLLKDERTMTTTIRIENTNNASDDYTLHTQASGFYAERECSDADALQFVAHNPLARVTIMASGTLITVDNFSMTIPFAQAHSSDVNVDDIQMFDWAFESTRLDDRFEHYNPRYSMVAGVATVTLYAEISGIAYNATVDFLEAVNELLG